MKGVTKAMVCCCCSSITLKESYYILQIILKHQWILIQIVLSPNAYSVNQTSRLNQTGVYYCVVCFCWQHLIPINFYCSAFPWWEVRGSIVGTSEFCYSLNIKEPAFPKHVQVLCYWKVTACSSFEVWYYTWSMAFGENTNISWKEWIFLNWYY